MNASPLTFDVLSAKLQQLAATLNDCHDAQERVALLKEFRRLLDQLYKLNESAVRKSE